MDRSRVQAVLERRAALKARAGLVASVAATAAPLILLPIFVSRPLVLPIYCLLVVAIAAMIALYAFVVGTPMNADRLTSWDVAGGYAMIGVAAAVLSEPMLLVAFFDAGTF